MVKTLQLRLMLYFNILCIKNIQHLKVQLTCN